LRRRVGRKRRRRKGRRSVQFEPFLEQKRSVRSVQIVVCHSLDKEMKEMTKMKGVIGNGVRTASVKVKLMIGRVLGFGAPTKIARLISNSIP
jgi:hypothetical protein